MIPPWFIVITRIDAKGGHKAGQVVPVLAFDMLLHNGQSRLQARGIDL